MNEIPLDSFENWVRRFPPKISLIVLNWNRLHLLKRTLDSIVKDVWVPYEIFVVDNASTDGSQDHIADWCAKDERRTFIKMSENVGGLALNEAFKQVTGDLVYVSENDLEYKKDWFLEMIKPFYYFRELGQLSPFSPFEEKDKDEVWEDKPATLVKNNNCVVYRAEGNVGTSCMIRRDILETTLQFRNIPYDGDSQFRLPDDADFSNKIKTLGYLVAWSKEYNVKNWGHDINEFVSDSDYYAENYSTKPLGKEGWIERINKHGYKTVEVDDGKVIVSKDE